jgi:hypothetical protein
MGKTADVKLVAGVVQMLLIRYDGCRCLGPLDACLHCELQMAQEALERLMVPEQQRREPTARKPEGLKSPLAKEA